MLQLLPVDGHNVWDILELRVREDQKEFVAPNDISLIEAYIALAHNASAFPFGIYDDETLVGFLMVGFGVDDSWNDAPAIAQDNYSLWRLMIDRRYQGRGYGRAAVRLALDFIKTLPCGPADYCWLSYEPTNTIAQSLYQSFGFVETGEKDGDEQIEVGDEVLVCGKVINYNGTTPEFASKENHLVSIKKASNPEPGTLENPFTVAQVLEAAGKLNGDEKEVSAEDYYIKGKISKIKFTFSAQYGTAQFHISADGAEEGDQFLIYGTYYLGNQPWVEGNTQIAVGDEVIICGKITNYNGTLETANKKSYIYSLNGQTE
jgi:diamine N-acetyltransferase